MTQFYVYLHCKPNGDPFYVGKGCDRGRDKRSHKFSVRNRHHQNIVAKYGRENVDILVFPRTSEQEAFDDEMEWIRVLRESGYELANKTDGGEGASGRSNVVTQETRDKLSESKIGNKYGSGNKGRIFSYETRAKISESKKGKPSGRLGCKFSEEHRAKLSLAKKGKPAPNRGSRHDLETRLQMSISHKKPSPETYKKIAIANSKPWSLARRLAQDERMKLQFRNTDAKPLRIDPPASGAADKAGPPPTAQPDVATAGTLQGALA